MVRQRKIRQFFNFYEELANDSQFLYVLFVDLCNSTEYKHYLLKTGMSDIIWMHRQLFFLNKVCIHAEKANGKIVKTMGDAVLATFDFSESAEDILHSCVDLVAAFSKPIIFTGKDKIDIKVSIDYGEARNGAIFSNEFDPIGLCVDRCARLGSETAPGEITFSQDFDKQLRIDDKTAIHPRIDSILELHSSFKGVGEINYYKLTIR